MCHILSKSQVPACCTNVQMCVRQTRDMLILLNRLPRLLLAQRCKKRQALQARLCYFFLSSCANFWAVYVPTFWLQIKHSLSSQHSFCHKLQFSHVQLALLFCFQAMHAHRLCSWHSVLPVQFVTSAAKLSSIQYPVFAAFGRWTIMHIGPRISLSSNEVIFPFQRKRSPNK